jgi:hypothetical protein
MNAAKQEGKHMSDSRQTSGPASDPWDAPYFGAPIYLSYPVFRRTAPGAVNGAVTYREQTAPNHTVPVEPMSNLVPTEQLGEPASMEPAPLPAPRRRGWFARLFGAR